MIMRLAFSLVYYYYYYIFFNYFFCFLFFIYYILIFLLEVGFTRDTDPSGSVHMYGPTSTLNVHTLV